MTQSVHTVITNYHLCQGVGVSPVSEQHDHQFFPFKFRPSAGLSSDGTCTHSSNPDGVFAHRWFCSNMVQLHSRYSALLCTVSA